MAHMIGSAVLDQSTVISSVVMLIGLGFQIRLFALSLVTFGVANLYVYIERNLK